jgi:uncharacterized protein
MIFDAHAHWGTYFRQKDPDDPSAWLAIWSGNGVTHGILLPLVGLQRESQIRHDNDAVAAACARSGGRMIPFCTVNPASGQEAVDELKRCLERLGMRGLKFHPWLQGVSPSVPLMDTLCEMAGKHGVPVLFHDGTPCYSLPSQVALLARRHPKATFILGHCGLFEHWREATLALNQTENLWGCLCSPHLAALREILRRCDRSRLLWGSDHGFSPTDVVGYRLQLLERTGWPAADREAILSKNPKRLFGLT